MKKRSKLQKNARKKSEKRETNPETLQNDVRSCQIQHFGTRSGQAGEKCMRSFQQAVQDCQGDFHGERAINVCCVPECSRNLAYFVPDEVYH